MMMLTLLLGASQDEGKFKREKQVIMQQIVKWLSKRDLGEEFFVPTGLCCPQIR